MGAHQAVTHHGAKDMKTYWEIENRTSIAITLRDQPGILQSALNVFTKNGINLTRIQSRPPKIINDEMVVDFYADFDGKLTDLPVERAIKELNQMSKKVTIVGTPEVPWFPTIIDDFDHIGRRTLSSGDGIQETDHPGFSDPEYRKRRDVITKAALAYSIRDRDLPRIDYTKTEKDVWKFCYLRLKELFKTNACEEFRWTIDQFEKHVGFTTDDIPQLDPISKFLQSQTGWRLKPVGGLLT
jgi:phenylalanine-4-hydroxylase